MTKHAVDELDRLRAVDPVVAETLPPIDSKRIEAALGRIVPDPRRSRTFALGLVVLAVAAAVALAAPALGIDDRLLNFLSAEPAPSEAVRQFSELSTGAPPGMDPGVIAGQTRKLTIEDQDGRGRALWLAPTRAGGFCETWVGLGGGCIREGTVPLSVSLSAPGPSRMEDIRSGAAISHITGAANANYVDSVELRFADGTSFQVDLAWVSEPIGYGFFTYTIPQARRVAEHRISEAAGFRDGTLVTVQRFPFPTGSQFPVERPPDAVVEQQSRIASIQTGAGLATMWTAPTRYDGHCFWLELEGRVRSLARCRPRGVDYSNGFELHVVPSTETVILAAIAGGDFVGARVEFADGSQSELPLAHGVLLYEVPRGHQEPGREARVIVALRDSGAETRLQLARLYAHPGPCQTALPLEPRTPNCP
jgi:hypothetical protein